MGIFDKLGSHGLVLAVAGVTVIAFLIVLRLAEPWLWKGASKTPNAARRLVQAGETLGLFLIAGSAAGGCVKGERIGAEIACAAGYACCGVVLLLVTGRLGVRLLLGSKLGSEIERGNHAAALAAGAHFVATAIIISRSVYGDTLATLGVSIAFFFIGQITLHAFVLLFRALTSYDDAAEIRGENVAAGLSYAGAMIALAVIIGHAADGTFTGWGSSLKSYALALLVSVALWPVRQLIVQTILCGGRVSLWKGRLDEGIGRERNVGLGAIEAVTYLATAMVATWLT